MCKILHIFVVINAYVLENFQYLDENPSSRYKTQRKVQATSNYDLLNFRKKSLIGYVAP